MGRARRNHAATHVGNWDSVSEVLRQWLASLPADVSRTWTGAPSGSAAKRPRRRGKSLRSLELIDAAASILEEIQPASIRAVCYRLFALGQIRSMRRTDTNRVSQQLTWAREQGVIPWAWVVDETRAPERVSAWADPGAFLETLQGCYRRDRWGDQPEWIEVWSEKGTIRGTLAPVLHQYGVTFRVMYGYGSATALNEVASETLRAGRRITAFYVGDWDPSGLHMSAIDLPGRLSRYGAQVDVERLALVEADLGESLPSFAVEDKARDSRYPWYVRQFGRRCWELDALSPVVLRDRVEHAIRARIDFDAWGRADVAERAEVESLTTILNAWPTLNRSSKRGPDSEC